MILRTLVVLLAVVSGACAARGGAPAPTPRPFPGAATPPGSVTPPERPEAPTPADASAVPAAERPSPAVADDGTLPALLHTALNFLGVPYRNGGSDPSGFDCSGFVQWVFGRHGLALPREVRDQYRVGREVDLDDVRPGDLLFFQTVSRGASHVGIALGEGRFVHAPSSRGVVRVEPYTASYWARRFVGARRVDEIGGEAANAPAPRAFPGSTR